jgi:nucleoside-diphosphate-sugar epimerase
MRVFVTGGTGFIGAAAVRDLLGAGHEVLGLARSDPSAAALLAAGATVLRGTLTDPDSLRTGAARSDGVLHLAMAHGETGFADALEIDRRALTALGSALEGTGHPLIFASGTSLISPGHLVTENDAGDLTATTSRGRAEAEVLELAERGVRVAVVRLATMVHGEQDLRGFIPMLVEMARARGVSAYVEDGRNRWPAVHQLDAARILRLAVEGAPPGSRLHAVADEGVPFREIATAIGEGVGVPAVSIEAREAAQHFFLLDGPLAALPGTDIPASSAITRPLLEWEPRCPDVLADLKAGFYFQR